MGGAGVTTDGSAITSGRGGGGSRVLLVHGGAVKARAGLHGQAGVDHGHQGTDRRRGVSIEVADGCVQVKLELVYQVGRNVGLRKSGHEAELVGGVVWHEGIHLDMLGIDVQTVRDTLGQESEDLADGSRTTCHKAVVQAIVETDLDEGAI